MAVRDENLLSIREFIGAVSQYGMAWMICGSTERRLGFTASGCVRMEIFEVAGILEKIY